ncbi:MAG: NnrS family protein [Rhodospirillaceae bacterium]
MAFTNRAGIARTMALRIIMASPFRLFFLLAGGFALVAMIPWLALLTEHFTWEGAMAPAVWHGHEMIFGYTVAVIAGFLLTAVADWTETPVCSGRPLAILGLLWLLGRLGMTLAPSPWVAMVADLLFLPALIVTVSGPLIRTGNRRQGLLMAALAALVVADAAIHLESQGVIKGDVFVGLTTVVDLVMIPIGVIGGRIIPAFTGNVLRRRGESDLPRTRPWVERVAVLSLFLVAALDLSPVPTAVTGLAAFVAGAVHAVRLSGWRGLRTLGQPILFVLHLGYGWLVVGLWLKALAAFFTAIQPTAALHALTIGAVGTLTIGVMTRVSRGHTGRTIIAGPFAVAAYVLLTAAALARVAGPSLWPDGTAFALTLAGGFWLAAFVAFLADQIGILTHPRIDGRPG